MKTKAKKSCILLWLVMSLCCSFVQAATPAARIIGGTAANANAYPWMVAISHDQSFICGGSLIDSHWVLTAAHCVESDPHPGRYQVQMGVADRANATDAVTRIPDQVVIHPSYNADTLTADIALLHFADAVSLTPVTLMSSTNVDALTSGASLKVIGWGLTSNSALSPATQLQEASVPLVDQQTCTAVYASKDLTLPSNVVCAGGGSTDSCFGDSGGPLFQTINGRVQQLGIVSFGASSTCADGDASVYTRPDAYAEFIRLTTEGWQRTLDFGELSNNHIFTRTITFTNPSNSTITFTTLTDDLSGAATTFGNTCSGQSLASGASCSFGISLAFSNCPNTVCSVSALGGSDLTGQITLATTDPDTSVIYTVNAHVVPSINLSGSIDDLGLPWFSGGDAIWHLDNEISSDYDGSVQNGAATNESTLMTYQTGIGRFSYRLMGELKNDDRLSLQIFDESGQQVSIEYLTPNQLWEKKSVLLPEVQRYTLVWRLINADASASTKSTVWLDGLSYKLTDGSADSSGVGALTGVYLMGLLAFWVVRRRIVIMAKTE